jgi:hypothetical protein
VTAGADARLHLYHPGPRHRCDRLPEWGAQIRILDHHATLVDDLDGDGTPDF